MELFFTIALVVLLGLAILDLVVGVSNDAVNFLNSAIGSNVATWKTIMIIASLGILFGTLSSSGMMELAKNGFFNPEYFSFREVMVIFVAVMLADIILLDLFNTLGMPTSTTVSIVFDILGAAVIVSLFKIYCAGDPLSYVIDINKPAEGIIGYMNWEKTSKVVSSIVLSVVIAFSIGVVVMYISRFLFTFNYSKKIKSVGIIWCAIAITCLSYFLLYKGMKSTFTEKELSVKEMKKLAVAVQPDIYKVDLPLADKVTLSSNDQEIIFNKEVKIQEDKEGNAIVDDSGNPVEEIVYTSFNGSHFFKDIIKSIKNNLWTFLGIFLLISIALMFVLSWLKVNILKVVVLFGTFCLAMAFAGNDLVNFIGVPLAGLQSSQLYEQASLLNSQLTPDTYSMIGLKFPLKTPSLYLLLAGGVMIVTLWFSKKARSVTETEVNLGRQAESEERFKPNTFSRVVVKGVRYMGMGIAKVLPEKALDSIEKRFSQESLKGDTAFDLVRASANLTIASIIIAIATDMKLPLSTTYVSFMVAMGTSLADKAWGRESAVYRVAGVINVIGGWFLTAIIAFSFAGFCAFILMEFELYGLIGLLLVLVFIITKSSIYHNNQILKKLRRNRNVESWETEEQVYANTSKSIAEGLDNAAKVYDLTLQGLFTEKSKKVKKATKNLEELREDYYDFKQYVYKAIKSQPQLKNRYANLYIYTYDLMQEVVESLDTITKSVMAHLENSHKPLDEEQTQILKTIQELYNEYFSMIVQKLNSGTIENDVALNLKKNILLDKVEEALSLQSKGISETKYGFKNSSLSFSILLETKDLVAISNRFVKLFERVKKGEDLLGYHKTTSSDI